MTPTPSIDEILRTVAHIISYSNNPSEYIHHICVFANAAAGSIWSNQGTTFSRNIFILKGVYNRPALQPKVNRLNIDITTSNVVGADAIREHTVVRGKYGCKPFDSNWQSKSYTADLGTLDITEIAIVPIFDSQNTATGWISLYFSRPSDVDSTVLESISFLMNSIEESISSGHNILRLETRKAKHEILAHTGIIQRKLTEIRSALPTEIVGNLPIARKFDDAIRSAKVLRNSYDRENFRERVRSRKDQRDSLSNIQMRFFLSNVLAAVKRENNPKRIDYGSIQGPDFSVLFNAEDLTMLFSNLYVNAFKYAKGGLVKTELNNTAHEASVVIMNEVASDQYENLDEIWHYEIRGENAIQSEIPGEGIGLGLVKDICDIYELEVDAFYKQEEQHKNTARFCVELKFIRPILLAGG